ncbi:MAG: hypothetical protein JNG86_13210 [Verrucomicrobiaceae bacterium]|nr:hypothetical protein [Verrucomicrobiaceae bacterium]
MNEAATCPVWKIWANPILRRYARARLRPQAWFSIVLLTLLIAGFIFFAARTPSMHRGNMLVVDAERVAIFPLMVLQALILFFLGTGQVAGGITGEADEGVLDYQRLTPMSPLAKVLGYWLGLPVREWVMFAVTLPFSAWCFWRGQVPFEAWASVYAVFITSALLYHLTGFTAGMVVKNRRWAFLMSMGVILVLYTIMPQVSRFGLLFFEYLTIWPVLDEYTHHFIPRDAGHIVKLAAGLMPKANFYGLEFREIVFTLFCQAGLLLTMLTMVWRRWRRVESHLLGKVWAVLVFLWMQVLLLGNGLPMIEGGSLFPSRAFAARFRQLKLPDPSLGEGIIIASLYGVVTVLVLLVLAFIITPTLDTQWRGLRRARKLALPHVPRAGDSAGSAPFLIAMIVPGALVWFQFAQAIMTSHWFPGHTLPAWGVAVCALTLVNALLPFQAVYEGWGGKPLFLVALFLGIVPPMVGFILGEASDALWPFAVWLGGASPLMGPAMAPMVLVPDPDLPMSVARSVPRAFGFWQGLLLLATVWLQLRLHAIKRQRRDLAHQTEVP